MKEWAVTYLNDSGFMGVAPGIMFHALPHYSLFIFMQMEHGSCKTEIKEQQMIDILCGVRASIRPDQSQSADQHPRMGRITSKKK
jgi:hypothetical protein